MIYEAKGLSQLDNGNFSMRSGESGGLYCKKKRRKTENLSENSRQYEENKTIAHFQVIDPMNNVHISHLLSLAFGLQRIKQRDLCLN